MSGTRVRGLQVLVVVSGLWASLSVASSEQKLERVTLSVKEPRQEARTEVVRRGVARVLPLRVVDPGRLVVKAGDQLLAECYLGWGEDERLRVGPLMPDSPLSLPRVVNRRVGQEEVEVLIPAELGAGELLTLTYEWDWKHRGKPALVRTWRLQPQEEDDGSAAESEFERDFPLVAAVPPEPEQAFSPDEEEEEPSLFAERRARFPLQVAPGRLELLWVPGDATREEIATRLFGDASAADAFDFEPLAEVPASEGMPRVAVSVRSPEALRPEVLEALRRALDVQLGVDAAWARAKLREESLSESDRQALVEMGLRWSQHSGTPNARGQSYFDHYLALLFPPGTELEWSLLGGEAESLRKATALRSKQWKTGYTVTDGSPDLAPGDVIGRCYFTSGGAPSRSSIPILVMGTLVEERSQKRAEVRVRNLPWNGMRALIPGPDGRFRGYGVTSTSLGESDPFEGPEARCYGYYPGTVFIRPGEWRPGVGRGTGELAALRRSILAVALAEAAAEKPEALLGLDHDVLELLTAEERLEVFATLLASPALTSEAAIGVLGRVVLSTPAEAFSPLERRLTESGALSKLLAGNAPGLALLGQAFTQKALGAYPLTLGSLESLPVFHLGREGETTHLLNASAEETSTTLIAPEEWSPAQGVRLGAEPAWPGEEAGPTKRTALRFKPVRQKFEARYLSSTEQDSPSQALHPLELVRVEMHGPQPRTRIMTAMELALHASVPDTSLIWSAAGRISELHLLYSGVSALARAPALAGAAATAEGGAAVVARQAAVRAFMGRTGLVASMATVDTYREELSRTQAGREFLAVHDFALLALASRDAYKLATSGILNEWGRRGGLALSQLGARASAGLREPVESAQALEKAVARMLAEGKATITPEGLKFSTPGGAEALQQAYFSVRGEMAAQRALGGIRAAGLEVQEAERILNAVKGLAEESQELARAYSAVARRAAALPADKAQAYLAAVESLCAATRPAAKPALAELLRGAGRSFVEDPIRFLKDAEWLVRHPGLDAEALGTLARKASNDSVDLGWLRSTALTAEDFNFLAKEKRTTWQLFKQAAEEPGDLKAQLKARAHLRGIAGEMVTERAARKLFPGYRLTGRQVALEEGSIIDFELVAVDGSLHHAVEVKGWTSDTWRRALKAWGASREAMTKLNAEQEKLVEQLRGVIKQLKNAAREPRGKPFLICSDKVKGKAMEELGKFLDAEAPATQLKQVEEAEMLSATKRLRAAFNLPERLPGETGGDAP
jgi:hypothetical protein